MSENDAKVVDLDATPAQAVLLAASMATWLLDEGVIRPNSRRDERRRPSDWMPGPHWTKAIAEPSDAGGFWQDAAGGPGFAYGGVDMIAEQLVHDPGGNFEAPPCPVCNSRADIDGYIELIPIWLEGPEPSLLCSHCNNDLLVGDWRWPFGFAVGNFAVRFNNWPLLDDTFVEEIARRLSGRWTLILGHY